MEKFLEKYLTSRKNCFIIIIEKEKRKGMNKMLAICYRKKEAIVYNKGTKCEKVCRDFFDYYIGNNMEIAKRRVAELNAENREGIEFWFIEEQEVFE